MKGQLFIASNVLVYIVFAFITLEMSPLNWSDLARALYAVLVFFVWGKMMMNYNQEHEDEE
jgi:hypothetical protein